MKILVSFLTLSLAIVPELSFAAPATSLIDAVSIALPGSAPVTGGNSLSGGAQISADGRWIVFLSSATDLVTNPPARLGTPALNIFRQEVASGQITLVSVARDGKTAGNGISSAPFISQEGRYVVFQSDAADLVSNDLNAAGDVFVRDFNLGTTLPVSVNPSGQQMGNGPSTLLASSPDGRFVVFESTATNLVTGDTNGMSDYFMRDIVAGTTRLVSTQPRAPFYSTAPAASVSSDGRFVAFTAVPAPPELQIPEAPARLGEIYVRDFLNNTTIWASSNALSFTGPAIQTNADGSFFNHGPDSYQPTLSGDGHFIYFKSALETNTFLFRHDLQTSVTTLISSQLEEGPGSPENPLELQTNPDGRVVLYETMTNNTQQAQIYLWDALIGAPRLVSAATNRVPANGTSWQSSMTPDGRYVVFSSDATDLVPNNFPSNDEGLPRHIYLRDMDAGTTRLVSLDSAGHASFTVEALNPDISADGQVITFDAYDSDLVPDDNNLAQDVFIRDLRSERTTLASRRNSALTGLTANGLSSLGASSVSSNGLRVVFTSLASNLAVGDTNGAMDVFLRDLALGTNILVSAGPNGVGNGPSQSPALSADGRFVAFSSLASNLVANDFNGQSDVFVRDLQSGQVQLVSVTADGQSGMGGSTAPSISADGRFVAFQSSATNLVATPNLNGSFKDPNVFVRDLLLGTTRLASISALADRSANGPSVSPVISPQGNLVVFQSDAGDLMPLSVNRSHVFLRDLEANTTKPLLYTTGRVVSVSAMFSGDGRWVAYSLFGTLALDPSLTVSTATFLFEVSTASNRLVCLECESPSISADGAYIAYLQRGSGNPPGRRAIWIYDRQKDFHFVADVDYSGNGEANGDARNASISSDGRFVVFQSHADNLVPGDTNGFTDVFLRDLAAGVTVLVSRSKDQPGSGLSLSVDPVLSADGRSIFFQSFSDDLVAGDYNGNQDVFRFRLPLEDSDADGLPDYWELAYFGDLSHNGQSDSDGDGQTDFAEFKNGTNPLDARSVLGWAGISLSGTDLTLAWRAVPGRSYRLQYKNSLTDPVWLDLPGNVRASGVAASTTAPMQGPQRFYRVVANP